MTSNEPMNGSGFLVLVNTGTAEVPVYEAAGYQRDATVEETNETIDVSSKDQREQRVIPGRYASTLSFDALYVPDDDAYESIKDRMRAGELILVARQVDDVVIETAQANVDSLSESYPDQGEATVSISMTIDGAWTVVGS